MPELIAFCRKYGLWLLIALHGLGIISIVFWSRDFAAFSAINLLITAAIIGLAHRGAAPNFWKFSLLTYFIGYGVELLGTQTGFPFGHYSYGEYLAPLFLNVPLIIGANWFVLAMASGFLTGAFIKNEWLRLPVASLLMVLIDVFIEQVAPALNYWSWKGQEVPLVNYLSWFFVSAIIQALWAVFMKKAENKVAASYYWVVLAFFIVLNFAL